MAGGENPRAGEALGGGEELRAGEALDGGGASTRSASAKSSSSGTPESGAGSGTAAAPGRLVVEPLPGRGTALEDGLERAGAAGAGAPVPGSGMAPVLRGAVGLRANGIPGEGVSPLELSAGRDAPSA